MTENAALDFVYGMAVSPAFVEDGCCFAARTSGLFRSEDAGITWALAPQNLNLDAGLAALAVAVSPAFRTDRMVFAGVAGGVLRSLDAGHNWEAIPLPSPPPVVTCLAVSPDIEQDGYLFAGTMEDGIFRSPDRGRSWHSWNFGLLDLRCLALAASPAFAEDETLFAATETALYRSTNGGRAWRETGLPLEASPVLSLALSPAFRADGVLFAGTDAGQFQRSRDRGRTWEVLGSSALDGSINAVLLSPEYPDRHHVLVLCDDCLWLSRDDGATWVPLEGEGISAVAAPNGLGTGAFLLAGTVGGGVAHIPLAG